MHIWTDTPAVMTAGKKQRLELDKFPKSLKCILQGCIPGFTKEATLNTNKYSQVDQERIRGGGV